MREPIVPRPPPQPEAIELKKDRDKWQRRLNSLDNTITKVSEQPVVSHDENKNKNKGMAVKMREEGLEIIKKWKQAQESIYVMSTSLENHLNGESVSVKKKPLKVKISLSKTPNWQTVCTAFEKASSLLSWLRCKQISVSSSKYLRDCYWDSVNMSNIDSFTEPGIEEPYPCGLTNPKKAVSTPLIRINLSDLFPDNEPIKNLTSMTAGYSEGRFLYWCTSDEFNLSHSLWELDRDSSHVGNRNSLIYSWMTYNGLNKSGVELSTCEYPPCILLLGKGCECGIEIIDSANKQLNSSESDEKQESGVAHDSQVKSTFSDIVCCDDRVVGIENFIDEGCTSQALVSISVTNNESVVTRRLQAAGKCISSPTISPDGSTVAWLSWGSDRSITDGCLLSEAYFNDNNSLNHAKVIDGSPTASVLSPTYLLNGSLVYLCNQGCDNFSLYKSDKGCPGVSLVCIGEARHKHDWGSSRYITPLKYDSWDKIALIGSRGHLDLLFIYDMKDNTLLSDDILPHHGVSRLWDIKAIDEGQVALFCSGMALTTQLIIYNFTCKTVKTVDFGTRPRTCLGRGGRKSCSDFARFPISSSPIPLDEDNRGWLFVPPGGEVPDISLNWCAECPLSERIPLIICPHTGWGDTWQSDVWDLSTQYFTSNGYAVCHITVSGCIGYERQLREEGFKKWIRSGAEDIISAVHKCNRMCHIDMHHVSIRASSLDCLIALQSTTLPGSFTRCVMLSGFIPPSSAMTLRSTPEYSISSSLLSLGDSFLKPESLRVPVLYSHCKDDCISSLEDVQRFISQSDHPLSQSNIVEGSCHPPPARSILDRELNFINNVMWDPL